MDIVELLDKYKKEQNKILPINDYIKVKINSDIIKILHSDLY
jgi:hypothetical protein